MKSRVPRRIDSFLVIVLAAISVWAVMVQPVRAAEKDAGRGKCEAKCRAEYQSDPSALQACVRACGDVGPASGGAIVTGPGEPAAVGTVKAGKSNSSDRTAAPEASGGAEAVPEPGDG
jgi:hypothetical protein